jgi:hypothetical protein
MSKQNTIKNTYADALFWAMSPKSKGKPYHITRTEESVFRKLTRYDKKNPKITYSNEIIADHTFLDITTIEKAIPSLNKKKWIKTITYQINDGSGKITSRRIVNINWDFVASVLKEAPKITSTKSEDEATAKVDNVFNSVETLLDKADILPSVNNDDSPIESDSFNEDIVKLSFDSDIETDDSEVDALMHKHQNGGGIIFIKAEIDYAHGMREKDEVVLLEGKEDRYFRKSHLNQLYPECFN